ncbi:MAG: hypothetical protein C5S48_01635 [Candidatus Methanogaster sp.]|nr:MAG: hypothetical protein C5S48_01635 [ANME-2 cluster archaeon]
MFREKRLYVDRLIKMSSELAGMFRILKIWVPRYDEFFCIEFSASTPKRRVRGMRDSIYLHLVLWSALISNDHLLPI